MRTLVLVLVLLPSSDCADIVDGDRPATSQGSLGAFGEVAPGLCRIDLDCGGREIPDHPKIGCALEIRDAEGVVAYRGFSGVEKRGRSSLEFPKPQYSLELRNTAGDEEAADLLGMGRESDWIVNGAYIDRALVRNKLLFDLFRSWGDERSRYAPQSAYCELVLDGDWRGIHLLTERIKRDDDRVDIRASDRGASFIVELADEGFVESRVAFANKYWKLVYPHRARATTEQRDAVRAWLWAWESAVLGDGSADPFDFLDLGSAVDFVLLQELGKNNDAYLWSVFLSKDVGGKAFFVPWDMDLTLGQPLYNENNLATGWVKGRPTLIGRLGADAAFQRALVSRWRDLRRTTLREEILFARLDSYRATFGSRLEENSRRWPVAEIRFLEDQLPATGSFEEEWSSIRAFLSARLRWMDQNIARFSGSSG